MGFVCADAGSTSHGREQCYLGKRSWDSFALMQDLQAMGESNAILGREAGPIKRDVLLANEGIYRELHGNEDGSLPATFRMIYMIGWKEGPNQSKPLERGSGDINIKDILGGGEIG